MHSNEVLCISVVKYIDMLIRHNIRCMEFYWDNLLSTRDPTGPGGLHTLVKCHKHILSY